VIVAGDHVGEDGLEVGGGLDGALDGRIAQGARAVQADVSIGPGLGCGPFHRVVGILTLIAIGTPLPLRPGSSPGFLDGDRVPPLGSDERAEEKLVRTKEVVVVVGMPVHQHGVPGVIIGPVDVGGQPHAISHRHHDIPFDDDVVGHAIPLFYWRERPHTSPHWG
jgi:hypothetical protein